MLAKYLYRCWRKGLMPTLKAVVPFHSVFEFWGWPSTSITSDSPSPSVLTEIGWYIVVKNLTPSTGYARDMGFTPGFGEISWNRKCQPTPVFLPGKSRGQRSWQATIYGARKKSDTTERLRHVDTHTHTHTHTAILFCGFKMSMFCHAFFSHYRDISPKSFLFPWLLLSDLKFCLLYQSYPHHYFRGDGVMLWHKAPAVNSWWLQMKSIGMFVVLYFNCFFCLKCFKI